MITITDSLNRSQWSLERGYYGDPDKAYPLRVIDSGREAGLDIALGLVEKDSDYQCRGFDQGFRVILNTPGEHLKLSRNSYRVPIGEDTLITIKPRMITTQASLLRYSSDQRYCFFSFERSLKFFRFYAQHNCHSECLSNFSKIECGCVKFSLPSNNQSLLALFST